MPLSEVIKENRRSNGIRVSKKMFLRRGVHEPSPNVRRDLCRERQNVIRPLNRAREEGDTEPGPFCPRLAGRVPLRQQSGLVRVIRLEFLPDTVRCERVE